MDEAAFENYKKRIISFTTSTDKENHAILFHVPETFITKWFIYGKEMVYPPRLIDFEGVQLFALHEFPAKRGRAIMAKVPRYPHGPY